MSTMTFPYGITGSDQFALDTILDARKLDTNFSYAANYFNCVSGGLEAAELASVKFGPGNLEEPSAVFWETLVVNRALGVPTFGSTTHIMYAFDNLRLHELRLSVTKADTNNAIVNAAVLPAVKVANQHYSKSTVPTGRGTVTYDDSKGNNIARAIFEPALEFPANTMPVLWVAVSSLSSNVSVVTLQARFSSTHCSR